jgi:preprotein translocase subunit YajC
MEEEIIKTNEDFLLFVLFMLIFLYLDRKKKRRRKISRENGF